MNFTAPRPASTRVRAPKPGARAIIGRAALDADIAALHAANPGDAPAFRAAALARLTEALKAGRAQAEQWLRADGQGLACAGLLSHLEDELIISIHRLAVTFLHPPETPGAAEKLAIVAVGGYGRGTLAPGSDIDLLFLLPARQTPWGKSVVEAILYLLWDLRQKVGHATRTVDECVRQARADMTIRTTLLETRLILGDRALCDELDKRFHAGITRASTREFVAAKLAERDQRLTRAGGSRYLVEPNVKEGKGGLRDLNTLFWISKYVYTCAARMNW